MRKKKLKMNTDSCNCEWPGNDALMLQYHNEEWGVPLHNDQKLFEFIILDAFQAGLSWKTILHKRENFRKAFDNFQPEIIALYDEQKVELLMQDSGIVRNRMKIEATIINAKQFLRIQKEHGSFDKYIWQFTDYKIIDNKIEKTKDIPVRTIESDKMSKSLRNEGFKFVGSTICYAFMQAAGMVNDHLKTCKYHRQKSGSDFKV